MLLFVFRVDNHIGLWINFRQFREPSTYKKLCAVVRARQRLPGNDAQKETTMGSKQLSEDKATILLYVCLRSCRFGSCASARLVFLLSNVLIRYGNHVCTVETNRLERIAGGETTGPRRNGWMDVGRDYPAEPLSSVSERLRTGSIWLYLDNAYCLCSLMHVGVSLCLFQFGEIVCQTLTYCISDVCK